MKKWMIFMFGLLFVSLIVATAYYSSAPNPGHYGNNISINVKGQNMTLQEGIDSRILLGYNLNGAFINDYLNDNSHSGSEISVIISGIEKTLQEAISSGTLCSNSTSSIPTSYPNPGHDGNKTLVKNLSGTEKTLQTMINDKEFCTCGDGICQNSTHFEDFGENETNCYSDCNTGRIIWGAEGKYYKSGSASYFTTCGSDTICSLNPTWGPSEFIATDTGDGKMNYKFTWSKPLGAGNYYINCHIVKDRATTYNSRYGGFCPTFDLCALSINDNNYVESWVHITQDNPVNINFNFTMPAPGNYQTICYEGQYSSGSKGSGSYQGYGFSRVRKFRII